MASDNRWLWQGRLGSDAQDTVVWRVVGDADTREIQARISLENFGNEARKSYLSKQRTAFDCFGEASTEMAISAPESVKERSAKRKQLLLDNVLGFGRLPRPR